MDLDYRIGMIMVALVLLVGCSTPDGAGNPISGDVIGDDSQDPGAQLVGNAQKVTIYFFWGDGCPHCTTQKPYLEEWEEKYSGKIEVKMFETWKNSDNVALFREAASAYGIRASGVPTTFIGERHWVGFSERMAGEMEAYIQSCMVVGCEDPLVEK